MKKIKIFLGGVINVPNAQNNNCRSIAEYIDKEKFELSALQSRRYPIDKNVKINYFIINKPVKLFKYFAFAWGIINSDISYLPKTECMKWNRFICRIFKKKYFRTIESVIDKKTAKQKSNIISDYKKTENLYSITYFMKEFNEKEFGVTCDEKILYLGVNDKNEMYSLKEKDKLSQVILIGHDLKRKGIDDYIELAKLNEELVFHVVGSGNGRFNINNIRYKNLKFHGSLSNALLEKLLLDEDIDLLILPSHVEGFPKVILECAQKGIPSLLYDSYGASDWIDHGHNGYVVKDFESMHNILTSIKANPLSLNKVRVGCLSLYSDFKWSKKIKEWENVIEILNDSDKLK